jgi:hypothetical protein
MAMTARVPVEGALELAGPGTAEAARAAFLEGMLLALVPSLLPLLVIHLRAPHRRQRQELGMLSLLWPPVVGSFAGMLLWLSLARLAAPALRPGGLATSPEALAVLALPQLLFVLAFWLAPQGLSRLDRTDTRSFLTALMAPILALPWLPLTPTLFELASGVGTHLEGALAATGFTLPALLAGLGAAVLSRREGGDGGWAPSPILGFLPLLGLIWISYLLLEGLPAHVVAFLQLCWLALSLVARLGATAHTRHARWALTLFGALLAAATLWLASG